METVLGYIYSLGNEPVFFFSDIQGKMGKSSGGDEVDSCAQKETKCLTEMFKSFHMNWNML